MLRRILTLSLLAALVLPLAAAAADKDKNATPAPKPAVDADKLSPGDFLGKLMTTPGTDGSFTVEMSYQHLEPNPNYHPPHNANAQANHTANTLAKDQQRIAHLQQQVARAKKPQDAARAMQQLEQAMAQMTVQMAQAQVKAQLQGQVALATMFRVVTDKKTIDFHAGENMVVRNLTLPTEFDEKGKAKKYTEEEKKKLRGNNPSLPGYEGKVENLQVGQIVKVTVVLSKTQATKSEDKDKDADKDKDKDKDKKSTAPKTHASMVVVVKDNSDGNTLSANDKKNKK